MGAPSGRTECRLCTFFIRVTSPVTHGVLSPTLVKRLPAFVKPEQFVTAFPSPSGRVKNGLKRVCGGNARGPWGQTRSGQAPRPAPPAPLSPTLLGPRSTGSRRTRATRWPRTTRACTPCTGRSTAPGRRCGTWAAPAPRSTRT